jgi:hypothetical protein
MYDLTGNLIIENPFLNFASYERHLCELMRSKYSCVKTQQVIGKKPSGNKHKIDVVSYDAKILVSAKLQNSSGTAEEKIPYEQLTLQYACEEFGFKKAYIVCAGTGWSLLEYYTSPSYAKLIRTSKVKLIKYDEFVGMLNNETKIRNTV